jgi:release factor glutamine methyltransferase
VSEALAGLPERAAAAFRHWESHLAGRLVPLPDQPAESVFTTLAALWHAAAGRPLSSRAASHAALPDLDGTGFSRLERLVEQRLEGTPLAHLTGRQHFMGLEMLASADALIPREETELVGRAALAALQEAAGRTGSARAIDLCTGSGNLALALAWHEPRASVWGADLSTQAVAFARRNAEHLGLAQRVTLVAGDLLEPFDTPTFGETVDVISCNPPYISSAKVETLAEEIRGHEPRLAFDGGPFGIRILARLIDGAPRLLRPGGVLAFEVGLGQGPGIRRRLERGNTWADLTEIEDATGETRALVARRRAGPG